MRTHLSHGSSGGGDMLLGEPKRACHRERATESVPPRAECAALRSGSRLRVVQRRRDRTTGAGSARRVHTRRVALARTARARAAAPNSVRRRRLPPRGARADSCTPAAARAAQRECRLTSGRLTMLGMPGSPSARAAASDTTSSQGDAFSRGRRGSFPPRGGVRRRPRRAPAALETSRRPGRALTRRDDLGEARRRARSFTDL